MLIRLRGCAGWSAPLLFAYDIRHVFSWPGSFIFSVEQIRRVFDDNLGIFSLFLHKNICYGYSLESPRWRTIENYPLIIITYPPYLFYWFSVECSTVANITTANETAEEKFALSTSSAQLVVETELDYESTTGYYFLMSIEDTGVTPKLTGYIAIRVR